MWVRERIDEPMIISVSHTTDHNKLNCVGNKCANRMLRCGKYNPSVYVSYTQGSATHLSVSEAGLDGGESGGGGGAGISPHRIDVVAIALHR